MAIASAAFKDSRMAYKFRLVSPPVTDWWQVATGLAPLGRGAYPTPEPLTESSSGYNRARRGYSFQFTK
jgi:hypothetical protein